MRKQEFTSEPLIPVFYKGFAEMCNSTLQNNFDDKELPPRTNIIIFVLVSTDVGAIEVFCTFHQNQPPFLKTRLEAGKHFPTSNHRNLPIASISHLT
jgi:hypothetical protein